MICYVAGILAKMKEGAEQVQTKLQAKVEGLKSSSTDSKGERNVPKVYLTLFFSPLCLAHNAVLFSSFYSFILLSEAVLIFIWNIVNDGYDIFKFGKFIDNLARNCNDDKHSISISYQWA